jgi:hypothetical protein
MGDAGHLENVFQSHARVLRISHRPVPPFGTGHLRPEEAARVSRTLAKHDRTYWFELGQKVVEGELQGASDSFRYREPKRAQVDTSGQAGIMPANEVCIVGCTVAQEVVNRSFQKRGGDPPASGDLLSQDTVPTDADRADSAWESSEAPQGPAPRHYADPVLTESHAERYDGHPARLIESTGCVDCHSHVAGCSNHSWLGQLAQLGFSGSAIAFLPSRVISAWRSRAGGTRRHLYWHHGIRNARIRKTFRADEKNLIFGSLCHAPR